MKTENRDYHYQYSEKFLEKLKELSRRLENRVSGIKVMTDFNDPSDMFFHIDITSDHCTMMINDIIKNVSEIFGCYGDLSVDFDTKNVSFDIDKFDIKGIRI